MPNPKPNYFARRASPLRVVMHSSFQHPKFDAMLAALDPQWARIKTLAARAACSYPYAQSLLNQLFRAGMIERGKLPPPGPRLPPSLVYRRRPGVKRGN